MLEFRNQHLAFLNDETPEIDLEGAQGSGKTIVALAKEIRALRDNPGMWSFITRWSEDDVHTLLRPEFERVCRIEWEEPAWNSREKAYEFLNKSRCFAFGLRTSEIDPIKRYGKVRGLAVSRIYVDQAEQLPPDFPLELRRRLRPDIAARVKGIDFKRQLTFTPNPTDNYHWLAVQYPASNPEPSRKYYALSLFDNAHNLPEDLIRQALLECPPSHPRYRAVILGLRPEIIDYSKTEKKPYPPDSAGALFEQARKEAREMAYVA